jgi:hypothetical protein
MDTPTIADLYMERIFMLENAYNQERDRADRAERERDEARVALTTWRTAYANRDALGLLQAAVDTDKIMPDLRAAIAKAKAAQGE